jgi:hypothetical protein
MLMNRRGLLKGILALPVASALGCQAENNSGNAQKVPGPGQGTLRVVLNGAFAIVIQKNARNRLRVFSPKDLSNLHEFYFNNPREPRPKTQPHNFELLPDGLEVSARPPEVDSSLSAFNVATDLWCQDEYFITIDLPAPQRISFMPPLNNAVLATGAQIHIPSNLVLEYKITDSGRVRMVSQDMKDASPIYFSDLVRIYSGLCSEKGSASNSSDCQAMERRYQSAAPGSSPGYFFGVGLAGYHPDAAHILQFFNTRILASFPHVAKRLELKSVTNGSANQNRTSAAIPGLDSAVWHPEAQSPRLLQVASVFDCTIAGPIVTHPISGGG